MTRTAADAHAGPGRPRAFDEGAALEAALQLFWREGYEAASLDRLTEAMGISRSSFYAAFGSKRAVLTAAVERYAAAGRARLEAIGPDAPALLAALANPEGGPQGCLLVNCITELAPHDAEIAALGRAHLAAIEALFARALSPDRPEVAADRARALTALALGAMTMRRSGVPPARIAASLAVADAIIDTA
jgi:TetR/AcrR family transcriptional repressor of nem operon